MANDVKENAESTEVQEMQNSGYEHSDIGWVTLLWIGTIIIVCVTFFVILLDSFFSIAKENEVYEAVLKPVPADVREMRAKEQEKLNSYGKVEGTNGVYHIPIDRAMQLLAEENFKKEIAAVIIVFEAISCGYVFIEEVYRSFFIYHLVRDTFSFRAAD